MGAESPSKRKELTLAHFTAEELQMIEHLSASTSSILLAQLREVAKKLSISYLTAYRLYRCIVKKFKDYGFDQRSITDGDADEWYHEQLQANERARLKAESDEAASQARARRSADDLTARLKKRDEEWAESARKERERQEHNKKVDEYNRRSGRGLNRHRRVV